MAWRRGAQDGDKGGISDRPDDETDVFHTFFGVAGLSLMGHAGLKAVDPIYALPTHVTARLKERGANIATLSATAAAVAPPPRR